MKVIILNGSPKAQGNTATALHEAERMLHQQGIETELIHVGHLHIHGCIACNKCWETGICTFHDIVNELSKKMRSPDGSADIYQLIAGLAVACRYGFELDNALEIAEKTYVNVNIHQKENEDKLKDLAQLPDSCEASADCLESQREVFEQYNVFSPAMIDGIIKKLRAYGDRTLRSDIGGNQEEMLKLVNRYFHCG